MLLCVEGGLWVLAWAACMLCVPPWMALDCTMAKHWCTLSVQGSWIEACKSKAVDILRVAASKFPGAITRMVSESWVAPCPPCGCAGWH